MARLHFYPLVGGMWRPDHAPCGIYFPVATPLTTTDATRVDCKVCIKQFGLRLPSATPRERT